MKRALLLGALCLVGVGSSVACSGGDAGGTGGGGTGSGELGVGGTGGSRAGAGGALGTGGVSATGGAGSGGGTGGASSGAGGSSASDSGSPGCGAEPTLESGRHTIEVSGEREYVLSVPDDYDKDHPYPLVFGFHWRGGVADDVAGGQGPSFGAYYGLEERAEGSMLFVAPEGLIDNGVTGWANPSGRDITFTEALLDHLEAELCVDTERVFSTGFSYGGMFSYAVGCALADRFRAIAPISGALWSGCEDGTAPIALWGMHGVTDTVVEIGPGRDARGEFLERNGCSDTSTPVEPSGCVSYDDCEAGAPLVWCEYNDGHWPPSYAPEATWEFFSGF
jgi:poly(3-hydroxybutyrate) depolymerase